MPGPGVGVGVGVGAPGWGRAGLGGLGVQRSGGRRGLRESWRSPRGSRTALPRPPRVFPGNSGRPSTVPHRTPRPRGAPDGSRWVCGSWKLCPPGSSFNCILLFNGNENFDLGGISTRRREPRGVDKFVRRCERLFFFFFLGARKAGDAARTFPWRGSFPVGPTLRDVGSGRRLVSAPLGLALGAPRLGSWRAGA